MANWYRNALVQQIKDAGQELINRAESMVHPENDLITDFSIVIHFEQHEVPTIDYTEAFNRAWLMHIHRNPHHWQYWVLINDEPKEGTILIEMPYPYIIEMICDWWAFSWIKGDLSEMFAWYKDHADYIKMHNNTRSIVEEILEMIRTKLTEVENAEN